ncbi:hypothetical protein ACG74X_11695 [Marivita sp. S0852]|uniref:hypothetical protein n=1 Tax=Marivita sp. S0852 TaxID=3373893 RepID=UPI0039829ECF
MATKPDPEDISTDYPGSKNHHSLKSDAGKHGDPTHADTDGSPPEDVAAAIDDADADTALAQKLKTAIEEDPNERG